MTIALTNNWEPLSWRDADGRFEGIVPQLLNELGKNTGIVFQPVTDLPWKRQLLMLDQGKLAAIAALNFNRDRAKKFALSRSYYQNDIHVFRHRDSSLRYTELKDLHNRMGVLPLGGSFGLAFDSYRQQHLDTVERRNTKEILEAVLFRQAEYFVLPRFLGNHVLRREKATDLVVQSGPPVASKPVHMALSTKHACLGQIALINAEIERLQETGWLDTVTRQVDAKLTN